MIKVVLKKYQPLLHPLLWYAGENDPWYHIGVGSSRLF